MEDQFNAAIKEIQKQNQLFHTAKALWVQAQEYLSHHSSVLKTGTRQLARWFFQNHLQEIQCVKDLTDAYYSPSFSHSLFTKWQESTLRASYQIAEDYAFFLRYQELNDEEGY